MATNQQLPEDSTDTPSGQSGPLFDIDVPRNWELVDDSDDAEKEGSILLEHTVDDYTVEVWRRSEDVAPFDTDNPELYGPGKWDVEYVDPAGSRRDGSGQFHDAPQEAIEAATDYIQSVRAEKRNRAEQEREAEAVDWPEQIGDYQLDPATASDTNAVYVIRYLSGYTVLGAKHRTKEVEIRWYSDTEMYHVGSRSFGRKQSAIEAATEMMERRTEKYRDIAAGVAEDHDLPAHHVPEHLKD